MNRAHTRTWRVILGIITEIAMAALIMAIALGCAWLISTIAAKGQFAG